MGPSLQDRLAILLNVGFTEVVPTKVLSTGFVQVRENWKSRGKSQNIFQSGNIDYSSDVREFEHSWVENQTSAHSIFR